MRSHLNCQILVDKSNLPSSDLLKHKVCRVDEGLIFSAQSVKSTVIQFTQAVGSRGILVVVRDASWFIMADQSLA